MQAGAGGTRAPLLRLDAIEKRFPPPPGSDGGGLAVLAGVSLEVAPGDTVAIVGPSGSGKSTLLHLIGGLDVPTAGRVLLDGRDLAALGDDDRAAARRRDLGFVFQGHHLLPQCSALENVLVPAVAGGSAGDRVPPVEAERRARALLDRVGLGARLAHRPAALSGGERQRVALARALLRRPRLLLADEPTGSLDRAAADRLADLLVELNREEGTALIVVTHAEALAARMARRYRLDAGRLEALAG